jgi:hypothetical protein
VLNVRNVTECAIVGKPFPLERKDTNGFTSIYQTIVQPKNGKKLGKYLLYVKTDNIAEQQLLIKTKLLSNVRKWILVLFSLAH